MLALAHSRGSSTLRLVGAEDLRARQPLPAALDGDRAELDETLDWARGYLCEPHPELGRAGPVCPYAGPSLKRDLLWLAVHPAPDAGQDGVEGAVREYRRWFERLAPVAGPDTQYKTILILFPALPPAVAPDLLDSVQAALKPEFVERGLMLGQFHRSCAEAGLWNARFRPMRSAVPLLAIRTMVRGDAPFLVDDAHSLSAYLSRFGDDVPARLRPAVARAARTLGVAYA
jgi:hypothetical protein